MPFVVLADGERSYVGAFTSAASSVTFDVPVEVEAVSQLGLVLRAAPSGPDVRADARIESVRAESGRLLQW